MSNGGLVLLGVYRITMSKLRVGDRILSFKN
jgi:hypothetical protein